MLFHSMSESNVCKSNSCLLRYLHVLRISCHEKIKYQDLSHINFKFLSPNAFLLPKAMKDGALKVNVSSAGIRNGFLLQADCRDQGLFP